MLHHQLQSFRYKNHRLQFQQNVNYATSIKIRIRSNSFTVKTQPVTTALVDYNETFSMERSCYQNGSQRPPLGNTATSCTRLLAYISASHFHGRTNHVAAPFWQQECGHLSYFLWRANAANGRVLFQWLPDGFWIPSNHASLDWTRDNGVHADSITKREWNFITSHEALRLSPNEDSSYSLNFRACQVVANLRSYESWKAPNVLYTNRLDS